MFAQHKRALVQSDRRGIHDLVGALVFQHAILVDARFMGKGVRPYDGLVGLNHHAGVATHHIAGPMNLLGHNVCVQAINGTPHMDGHGALFQAGVAGPFADAVDRHLDLTRTIFHTGQRVGGSQPKVIVTVTTEDHILPAGRVLTQLLDQGSILFGRCVAHRVRYVQRGSALP